jgi:hypothetical protein
MSNLRASKWKVPLALVVLVLAVVVPAYVYGNGGGSSSGPDPTNQGGADLQALIDATNGKPSGRPPYPAADALQSAYMDAIACGTVYCAADWSAPAAQARVAIDSGAYTAPDSIACDADKTLLAETDSLHISLIDDGIGAFQTINEYLVEGITDCLPV